MDVAMLQRAVDATRPVVAGISPDQFEAATPCTEWDVRDLLNHLIGEYEAIAAAAGLGVANSGVTDFTATDHVGAYDGAAAKATKALAAPGALEQTLEMPWGPTPGNVVLGLTIADTVVHGWDLAKATGQELQAEPDVAEAVYGMTSGMMEPNGKFPRGDSFAPPVEVPDDAPIQDKMLAYLGRQP